MTQSLDDSLIPKLGARLHPAFVFPSAKMSLVPRGKCLFSGLLGDFILSIQCWQSVFNDYVHVHTPKRVSGLAKPRSAPNIITEFPLLLHLCLPNSTSSDLQLSGLKGNHSDGVNPVSRRQSLPQSEPNAYRNSNISFYLILYFS